MAAASSNYVYGIDPQEIDRLGNLDTVHGPLSMAWLAAAGVGQSATLLDVGCGGGHMSRRLAQAYPNLQIVGTDANPAMVAACQGLANEAGLDNVRYVEANACHLDKPFTERFDVVYSRFLMAHLDTPLQALKAMAAVAHPSGRLFVEDIELSTMAFNPSHPALARARDTILKLVRLHGGNADVGAHLPTLCQQAGWQALNVDHYAAEEPQAAVKRVLPQVWCNGDIQTSLLRHGLLNEADLETVVAMLEQQVQQTTVTLPLVWRVHGTLPPTNNSLHGNGYP
ncbi:MAG: class I SAM-dependent methyltransferase [Cyanobacteria bacterium HKST-UBA05]|nr:class I SAM-dependent methyltransferase [Cyanobacteria bacterium HKST-UBA05]